MQIFASLNSSKKLINKCVLKTLWTAKKMRDVTTEKFNTQSHTNKCHKRRFHIERRSIWKHLLKESRIYHFQVQEDIKRSITVLKVFEDNNCPLRFLARKSCDSFRRASRLLDHHENVWWTYKLNVQVISLFLELYLKSKLNKIKNSAAMFVSLYSGSTLYSKQRSAVFVINACDFLGNSLFIERRLVMFILIREVAQACA